MTYNYQGATKDRNWFIKLIALGVVSAILSLAVVMQTFAAAPTQPLQCFSGTTDGGYNGTCTLTTDGAVLNTIDNDSDPNNNYAGVYYETTSLSGQLIGDVTALSFDYAGSGAVGGSPRFSIPIDENNDGTTEAYAYVDTVGCNDGDANTGTGDVVNDTTCNVAYDGVVYANWAAFVAANPTFRIATDTVPFVIVDQPGEFTITNVVIGTQEGSAKDACKNGGWSDLGYRNQGQCVATMQSSPHSRLNQ